MEISDRDLENEILAIAISNDEAKDTFNDVLIDSNVFFYEIHRFISNEIKKDSTSTKVAILKKLKGKFSDVGFRFDYFELRGYKEKCFLLLEIYAKRIAYECSQILDRGLVNEVDIFQLRNDVVSKLEAIDNLVSVDKIKPISKIIEEVQEEAKHKHENEVKENGVKSRLVEIDKIIGGFQESALVILAARPGMGKTALIVSIARNATVIDNSPVAIFSLEMDERQLVKRLLAAESNINAMIINNGIASESQFTEWNDKANSIKPAPLYIDDTPALKLIELRAKVRKLVKEKGIKLVIIDYLQLMSNAIKGNREQEISSISRGLKVIAKEHRIPVIALSQLSRSVEQRGGDKKPMLSDLRESGAIEQDADIIGFLYRAEYYGITEDEEGNSTNGKAELIIAKHRDGALATAPLKFIDSIAKFENIEEFQDFKPDKHIEPNTDFEDETPF